MLMNRTQRLIIALRDKFPGDETDEGVNFSHAAEAIGVSRQSLINWLRKNAVDIRTKNWEAIAKATGYNRHWLELEEGPPKPIRYQAGNKKEQNAIAEKSLINCPNIQYIKWSQLGILLDSSLTKESNAMNQGRIKNTLSFAIELESNQFAPYAVAGESILVEPNATTHAMKVLAEIDGEYYILIHDKLQNRFSDIHGNDLQPETQPTIIGTITQIFGASRKG
jgi:hypothetical protein